MDEYDLLPIIRNNNIIPRTRNSLDLENTDYSRVSRDNLPTVSNLRKYEIDADVCKHRIMADVRKQEIASQTRRTELQVYSNISSGHADNTSEWLRNRARGESSIDLNTTISESGRGIFGSVGRYASVSTSVKIR